MRRPAGFTLIEVLTAAALLLVSLTLVGAGLGRHLAVLDRLRESALANDLAEELLTRETLRRQGGVELPEPAPRDGQSAQLELRRVTLSPQPVKDVALDEAVAQVTWSAGGQSGKTEITTAFAPAQESPAGQ